MLIILVGGDPTKRIVILVISVSIIVAFVIGVVTLYKSTISGVLNDIGFSNKDILWGGRI